MIATQESPSEACRLGTLSVVPEGWRVERAKVFFCKVDERSEKGEEELLSVSHMTGVTRRSEKNVTMFQAESYAGFKTCQAGDLVVNSMWAWMKAMGVAWEPGIISTAYGVYRLREPEDWNLKFIDYLVRCDFMGGEYLIRSKGIHSSRWLLSDDDFGNVPFICPPRPEQDAIVAYLDGKLERIDRYLRVKEREIALLEERKRALIHRAVTRGLDPKPQLQPTGIPWLPEIPVGWEVVQLRRVVARVKTGGTPPGATEDQFAEEGGYPWFTPGDFTDSDIVLSTSERALSAIGSSHCIRFPRNSVMMVGIGTVGKVGVPGREASCNQQINAIVPGKKVKPEFLAYFLMTQQDYIFSCGKFTTIPILNQDETKNLQVFVPPLDDQETITEFICEEAASITTTITRARRQIERMQEYRTALIAEAVTGKIDVTGKPG